MGHFERLLVLLGGRLEGGGILKGVNHFANFFLGSNKVVVGDGF